MLAAAVKVSGNCEVLVDQLGQTGASGASGESSHMRVEAGPGEPSSISPVWQSARIAPNSGRKQIDL